MRVRTLNDEVEKLASYLIQNQASKKSEQWSIPFKVSNKGSEVQIVRIIALNEFVYEK